MVWNIVGDPITPESLTTLATSGVDTGIITVRLNGVDYKLTIASLRTLVGTALAAPGAPGVPVQGATGATTMALSWAAPTTGGAVASYTLQSSPTGANTWTTIASPTTASVSLSGLSASTGYDFRVSATNATGTSAYSPVLTNAATSAAAAAPNAVTSLAASNMTTTTIPLTWVESGGTPTTRTVTTRTPSGSANAYVAAAGTFTATGGTITGLVAGSTYDVSVTESNATGTSAATVLTNIATLASAGSTPNAATGVTIDVPDSASLPIYWTAPAAGPAPTGYKLYISTDGATGSAFGAAIVLNSTDNFYRVTTGISAATAYVARVVPFNASGDSVAAPTNSAAVTTKAATGVPSVRFSTEVSTGTAGVPITGLVTSGSTGGLATTYMQWGYSFNDGPFQGFRIYNQAVGAVPTFIPATAGVYRLAAADQNGLVFARSRPIVVAASGAAQVTAVSGSNTITVPQAFPATAPLTNGHAILEVALKHNVTSGGAVVPVSGLYYGWQSSTPVQSNGNGESALAAYGADGWSRGTLVLYNSGATTQYVMSFNLNTGINVQIGSGIAFS